MATQHLYKPEEVETVRHTIADGFLLDSERVTIDGNVLRSIKSGRRTRFPLKFKLRIHKEHTLAYLLSRAEKLTGVAGLYNIDVEAYGGDNHVILELQLDYDDFNRILILAKASIPKT